MAKKLKYLIYLSRITLYLGLIGVFPLSAFAELKIDKVKSCLPLGQGGTQGGVQQKDNKLPIPCCKPLRDREAKELFGTPTGGGYQYVCIACGDGKCDPFFENACNCHEDCN